MRTLIAALMATAASFIAISAANAADAVEQIPQAPVAVEEPAPAANWQGFYLGAYGAYDWGRFGGGDHTLPRWMVGAGHGYRLLDRRAWELLGAGGLQYHLRLLVPV